MDLKVRRVRYTLRLEVWSCNLTELECSGHVEVTSAQGTDRGQLVPVTNIKILPHQKKHMQAIN